jgi:hypothetical protein
MTTMTLQADQQITEPGRVTSQLDLALDLANTLVRLQSNLACVFDTQPSA